MKTKQFRHAARREDALGQCAHEQVLATAQFGSPPHTQGTITGEVKIKHILLFSLPPKQVKAPTIHRQGQQLAPGWVAIASAQHSEI